MNQRLQRQVMERYVSLDIAFCYQAEIARRFAGALARVLLPLAKGVSQASPFSRTQA